MAVVIRAVMAAVTVLVMALPCIKHECNRLLTKGEINMDFQKKIQITDGITPRACHCSGSCYGGCSGGCDNTCRDGCKNGCYSTCIGYSR